jgi:hypothetical protein
MNIEKIMFDILTKGYGLTIDTAKMYADAFKEEFSCLGIGEEEITKEIFEDWCIQNIREPQNIIKITKGKIRAFFLNNNKRMLMLFSKYSSGSMLSRALYDATPNNSFEKEAIIKPLATRKSPRTKKEKKKVRKYIILETFKKGE